MAHQSIKQRLEKKFTFEQALQDLTRAVASPCQADELQQLLPLVTRVHTLLRTRYSNISFWKQGQALFEACKAQPGLPAAAASKLGDQIAEAHSFAAEADPQDVPVPEPTLGELLFGIQRPQAQPSHLSDAGLVLDHSTAVAAATAARAATLLAAATAAAAFDEGDALPGAPVEGSSEAGNTAAAAGAAAAAAAAAAEGDAEAPSGAAAQLLQALQELLPPEVLQQLQQQQRLEGGASLSDLQLLEAERLAQLLSETVPANSAPPRPAAAKAVVARLPTIGLTREQAAAGDKCPVCTEAFSEGDAAQQLPCQHLFHSACLAPWLQQDNSCPMCRKELPTDDWRYEAKKEREEQEAEDRRGADNALSHNEFMYT